MKLNILKTGPVHSGDSEVANLIVEKDNTVSGVLWQEGGNRPRLKWTLEGNSLIKTYEDLDMCNISIIATVGSQEVPLVLNKEEVSEVVGDGPFNATIHWNVISKGFSSVSFGSSGNIRLVTTEEIADEVFYEYLPY